MGLSDSILRNFTGAAQGSSGRGGTTSPLTKALLMLLAAKAYQHYTSRPQGEAKPSGSGCSRFPQGSGMGSGAGGGLGGMLGGSGSGGLAGGLLGGGLGGLLGSLVGGGGLNNIVDQFRNSGHANVVDSWVGRGANQPIAPHQLGEALGPDTLDELAGETGMPRDELLSELSQELPDAIDQFTPDGRIPTETEVSSRWV